MEPSSLAAISSTVREFRIQFRRESSGRITTADDFNSRAKAPTAHKRIISAQTAGNPLFPDIAYGFDVTKRVSRLEASYPELPVLPRGQHSLVIQGDNRNHCAIEQVQRILHVWFSIRLQPGHRTLAVADKSRSSRRAGGHCARVIIGNDEIVMMQAIFIPRHGFAALLMVMNNPSVDRVH